MEKTERKLPVSDTYNGRQPAEAVANILWSISLRSTSVEFGSEKLLKSLI